MNRATWPEFHICLHSFLPKADPQLSVVIR